MQRITQKSDVYSFGIVLLEVLTGRHPLDPTLLGGAHLVQWVREHLQSKNDPVNILDQKLRGRADPQMHEMLQTLAVSFLCISTRADEHPTMKDVVAMLREIRHDMDRKVSKGEHACKECLHPHGGKKIVYLDDSSVAVCSPEKAGGLPLPKKVGNPLSTTLLYDINHHSTLCFFIMAEVKKNRGRQKIVMEKMQKKSNLQVTFSKRRTGLFKKASELSTLCGAEIAIVVFSPGKRVFSYGNPCVDMVINRFLSKNSNTVNSDLDELMEFQRDANVRELNAQLSRLLDQLEMEKRRGEELDQAIKATQMRNWWEAPVEQLGEEQLKVLKISLDGLKKEVEKESQVKLVRSLNLNSVPYYNAHMGNEILSFGEATAYHPYGYPSGSGPRYL
ncbi:Transcription factor, MADS-box [Dillenia turbinata]|uniref:Transcription factor, MADS-box n=1 Tax=Dillenia turbinata TaxID=194707 RepID=A0AAN8WC20_9MAGN